MKIINDKAFSLMGTIKGSYHEYPGHIRVLSDIKFGMSVVIYGNVNRPLTTVVNPCEPLDILNILWNEQDVCNQS